MREYCLVTRLFCAKNGCYSPLFCFRQRSTVMKHNAQRRRRAAKRRYLFLRRQSVRSVWMKERSNDWWGRIVWQTFSSYNWMENFRMSRETFVYVCNEVRELVKKENTSMRDSIPTEQQVAIALWYLSSGSDFCTRSVQRHCPSASTEIHQVAHWRVTHRHCSRL